MKKFIAMLMFVAMVGALSFGTTGCDGGKKTTPAAKSPTTDATKTDKTDATKTDKTDATKTDKTKT